MDWTNPWGVPQIPDPLNPFAALTLEAFPHPRGVTLRAWNSADRLLVEYTRNSDISGTEVLAVNDSYGALALATGARLWTDSSLSVEALRRNLLANPGQTAGEVIPLTEKPPPSKLVLLKIPKQHDLLQWQLRVLSESQDTGTRIVCAGMDKHLSPNTAEQIEAALGPTERLRGERKARLFVAHVPDHSKPAEPEPQFDVPGLQLPLVSHPALFSAHQLDIGSRFMIEQMAQLPSARHLLDLACGCGVLGIAAAQRLAPLHTAFCDESYTAGRYSERNWGQQHPSLSASFHTGDGLADYDGPQPELILCNPPFHLHHIVDAAFGQRLISQAAGKLESGGKLWLVANRHLPYAGLLRRQFANLREVAQNKKFIIWEATKA